MRHNLFSSLISALAASVLTLMLASCSSLAPSSSSYDCAPQELCDPQMRTGVLDNGLRYYVRANTFPAQRAQLQLLVNVGSLQEAEDQRGYAHFIEHMAFNGTDQFPQQALIDYFEAAGMRFGAHLNAYTAFDQTVYQLQVPTDEPEVVQTGLQVLNQWARHIAFSPTQVEQEIGVVVAEWRGRQGVAQRLSKKIDELLYRGSRYQQRSPIGEVSELRAATAESLQSFYRQWYQPQNMAVVVVGDLDVEEIESRIRSLFSDWQPSSSALPQEFQVPTHGTQFAVLQDAEQPVTQLHFYSRYPAQAIDSLPAYRDALRFTLINQMLYARLQAISRQADSSLFEPGIGVVRLDADTMLWQFSARTTPDAILDTHHGLLAALTQVARFGFTRGEFDRAVTRLLTGAQYQVDRQSSLPHQYFINEATSHFFQGDAYSTPTIELALQRQLYKQISLPEINRQLEQRLRLPDIQLVIAPQQESLRQNLEDKLRQQTDAFQKAQLSPWQEQQQQVRLMKELPSPGEILSVTPVAAIDAEQWLLSNGTRVLVKSVPGDEGQILFRALRRGGYSQATPEQLRSAMSAARLVNDSGVNGFDRLQLENLLSGNLLNISTFLTRFHEGISGATQPEDLEIFLQLVHLYFTRPSVEEARVDRYRKKIRDYQSKRLHQPEQLFFDHISKELSQQHWQYQPWTRSMADEVQAEQALDFYQSRFSNVAGFDFLLVGDLQGENLRPLVARYLASLPAGELRTPATIDMKLLPEQRRLVVNQASEPKTLVRLSWHRPLSWQADRLDELSAIRELLKRRLRQELREEQGGVYSVGVNLSMKQLPYEHLRLDLSFTAAPEEAQQLITGAKHIVQQFAEQPIASQELDTIKSQWRREFQLEQNNSQSWMSLLSFYVENGLSFDRYAKFEQRLNALSSDSIRAVAKELFKDWYLYEAVLAPRDKEESAD